MFVGQTNQEYMYITLTFTTQFPSLHKPLFQSKAIDMKNELFYSYSNNSFSSDTFFPLHHVLKV